MGPSRLQERTCAKCDGDNPSSARFCMHCGAPLPVACPICDTPMPDGARFCFACGVALDNSARDVGLLEPQDGLGSGTDAQDDPIPSFEPEQCGGDDAHGELKHITSLFVDIVGSTTLVSGVDPEDARELLNTVMSKLSDRVSRLGGTVVKFMGDGMFAIFGAPLAQENHAFRACLAATEMHRAIEAELIDGVGEIQLRIGLHSGNAVIDQTGEGPNASVEAIGESVNIAAHLEASASAGSTLISQTTRQLAGPAVETVQFFRGGQSFEVSGIGAWVLTGCRRSRHALLLPATESNVPFVGRQREAVYVRDAVAGLQEGRGQVITILGETGVGKTRFLAETLALISSDQATVIHLAGQEIEQTNPDAVLKDFVWSILGPNDTGGALHSAAQVGARLAEIEPTLADAGRACAWFLSIEQESLPGAEAEKLRIEALSQIKGLIYQSAQRLPLIVALDDFQWVDESSRQFINRLAPLAAECPLLVLVACRNDEQTTPDNLPQQQVLTLLPLSDSNADQLLSICLGEHGSVREIRREILAQAQNSPRFIIESVRALNAQQVLVGEFGDFVLMDVAWENTIPANIADVFEARIDRLPATAKRLLQLIVTYGSDIKDEAAAEILQVQPDAILEDFITLCCSGLLKQIEFIPSAIYRVANPGISTACYRALVRVERKRLHQAICNHLAKVTQAAAGDERDPRLIGFHAFRAGEFELAACTLLQAGTRAYARLAYGESADLLRDALKANDQRAEGGTDRTTMAVDIRLALRDALFPRAAFEEITRLLEEAEALTLELEDDTRRRAVQRQLVSNLLSTGRLAEARPRVEALIAETIESDTPRETVDSEFLLVQILVSQGWYAEAEELARGLLTRLSSAEEAGNTSQTVLLGLTRMWAIWCAAEQGRFEQVMSLVSDSQDVLSSDASPFAKIVAGIGSGLFWLRYGEIELAAETLQSVLPLSELMPSRAWYPAVASPLGLALVRLGQTDLALDLLQRAIAETPYRYGVGRCLRLVHLAECYLASDQPNEALAIVSDGLNLAERTQELGAVAYALTTQAKCLSLIGREIDAEASLNKALATARSLDMVPLVSECETLLNKQN